MTSPQKPESGTFLAPPGTLLDIIKHYCQASGKDFDTIADVFINHPFYPTKIIVVFKAVEGEEGNDMAFLDITPIPGQGPSH